MHLMHGCFIAEGGKAFRFQQGVGFGQFSRRFSAAHPETASGDSHKPHAQ